MGIVTYIPDSKKIIHKTKVDFMKRIIPETVYLVQYDSMIPIIEVDLYSNGAQFTISNDENINMVVRWGKKTAKSFVIKDILGCNTTRNSVYFSIDREMSDEFGIFNPIIELVVTVNEKAQTIGSSSMIFSIDANPIQE